jgi:flagellar protein FlbB
MARYSVIGIGTRIFVLLLLLVVFVVGGTIWFDYLGLIDAKDVISPVLGLFGLQKRTVIKNVDDPLLLERERLKKQAEAFDLIGADLDKKEADLATREKELEQLAGQVEQQQNELTDKENSFNERRKAIENRKVNLEQTSDYLVGMPPKDAVAILEKMDDGDIIDIFRATEEKARKAGETSIVSYWLSLMSKDRAAALNRKMARAEGE